MNITISIDIEVTSEADFRQAARDKALEDGLGDEDAALYLDDDEKSLGDCAVMLFDPGVSPNGCSIIQSHAD